MHKWTAALKAVKPDFVAAPWTTGPGRWWHWMGAPAAEGTDAVHRVLDAPFLELFWDFPPDQGSNLLPAFTCRYYRGLTGDRPAWILPYLCEQGQFNMQPPRAECDLREMTVLTNGCLVAQGFWQQNEETSLAHLNKLVEEREPFTREAKSLKWAAMLVGESSRLLYGLSGARTEVPLGAWIGSGVDTPDRGKLVPGERRMPAHMESAVGVFRALMEDHLPLDIIIEPDVENAETLRQYKVLILPNAACLSAKALETIRGFVKEGGGLVAMHESSLCNEFGDRRADFGLADLYRRPLQGHRGFLGALAELSEMDRGLSGDRRRGPARDHRRPGDPLELPPRLGPAAIHRLDDERRSGGRRNQAGPAAVPAAGVAVHGAQSGRSEGGRSISPKTSGRPISSRRTSISED